MTKDFGSLSGSASGSEGGTSSTDSAAVTTGSDTGPGASATSNAASTGTSATSTSNSSSTTAPEELTTTSATGGCAVCDQICTSCQQNQDCKTIDTCVGTCIDGGGGLGCFPTCQCMVDQGSMGVDLYQACLKCESEQCQDTGGPQPDPCAAEKAACEADAECEAMRVCIGNQCTCMANDNLACWGACKDGHSQASITKFNAYWSCVGNL